MEWTSDENIENIHVVGFGSGWSVREQTLGERRVSKQAAL